MRLVGLVGLNESVVTESSSDEDSLRLGNTSCVRSD